MHREVCRITHVFHRPDDGGDGQALAEIKAHSGFDYSASWERQKLTTG
jgi:hypothetical protein